MPVPCQQHPERTPGILHSLQRSLSQQFTSTTTALFTIGNLQHYRYPLLRFCLLSSVSGCQSVLSQELNSCCPYHRLVAVRAFLQSIMPAPVISLNSFTISAVIAIIIFLLNSCRVMSSAIDYCLCSSPHSAASSATASLRPALPR